MRILVSAYACEPGSGSEPGVGWTWAEQLSTLADVTVITRTNNKAAIEDAARQERWVDRVTWVYHDLAPWALALKRLTQSTQGYYVGWQYSVSRRIRKMCSEAQYDYVHHLTFGNYWLPYLTTALDVETIVGPMGGAECAPIGFALDSIGPLAFETARNLVRGVCELLPGVRGPARRATACIAKAPETAARLRTLGAREVVVRSEVALPAKLIGDARSRGVGGQTLRFVSVGRLLHLKGYQLALRALAEVGGLPVEFSYTLIGDGPYRPTLERLTSSLGLTSRVHFAGQCARADVLEALTSADVFIHPSLHDSGGWACLEAMAAGLPVVCLDIGGPATQVSEEVGIVVHAGTRTQCVRELGAAVRTLANDASLRARMGHAGRERVRAQYTEEALREWLRDFYGKLNGEESA